MIWNWGSTSSGPPIHGWFNMVSLCLKESLALPTRGCFVCHVHCLVHDGDVRSSPCRPHHENFGRNLYHMFVSGLFPKSILCSCFCCGIRVASMSSVDSLPFPKWCSHIPMWILILLDNRDCHVNPFQPVCLSSSGSDHFNISKIIYQFFSMVFVFHSSQVAFVF